MTINFCFSFFFLSFLFSWNELFFSFFLIPVCPFYIYWIFQASCFEFCLVTCRIHCVPSFSNLTSYEFVSVVSVLSWEIYFWLYFYIQKEKIRENLGSFAKMQILFYLLYSFYKQIVALMMECNGWSLGIFYILNRPLRFRHTEIWIHWQQTKVLSSLHERTICLFQVYIQEVAEAWCRKYNFPKSLISEHAY